MLGANFLTARVGDDSKAKRDGRLNIPEDMSTY
jgi:hypothetical protein